MIKTRINKKQIKLKLNKQTITHLNPGQMARLGAGGNDKQSENGGLCNTCHDRFNFQSEDCPTYDTGIPPFAKKNHTV